MNNNFALMVANRTLTLLDERKARLYPDQTAFYVWAKDDRVVVIFDTNVIDIGKVNGDFAHRISTRLQGRRVVKTNSRGLFLQVGIEIPPLLEELAAAPLDLLTQPTPYHLPIGTTENGSPLWVSLLEGDSFLLAGSRGMGKTGEVHGFIQALLHGGAVDVYAHDGKRGVEFGRYMGNEHFHMVTHLGGTLEALRAVANDRRKTLLASGAPNCRLYNETHPEPMRPIALIVDEAALTSDAEKALLVALVEKERDTGIHPIICTNRPDASALLMKTNLVTRICFSVPSWNQSQMVLGMNGAEALQKVQGRGLIVFRAAVTEFQSFRVTYPAPKVGSVEHLLKVEEAEDKEHQAKVGEEVDVDLEKKICTLAGQNMSMTAIVREVWGSGAGDAFAWRSALVKKVISNLEGVA